MTIGEFIQRRRKELDLTLEEIGLATGVGKSTVKKWETGFISNMGRDKIKQLAKILNVSPSVFINESIDDYSVAINIDKYNGNIITLSSPTVTDDVVSFPVIGNIAAGYDEIAVEDWSGETVDVPVSYLRGRNKSEFFVLKVKGDSMYPLYHEGDKVLILKQSTLNRSGDIGAVMYEGECATLKKIEYVKGEDWMRLIPINPNYIPKTIEGVDLENCRVLGIPFVLIREFY
ncbi:MAG: helix-turn-helix domain-containing protein [Clostridia bacterium]|nr:helix-turn-helix domain-containing protein [Clostridia bacterium]MBP3939464.1 helix-turn-helix domain-containing protein [Clostridia bacterium]